MLLRRRQRVLLLDDDPSMQRLVSALLKKEGFRVDVVLTGRQAIASMDSQRYDVVLLDLMMPHEGGITVIRELEGRGEKEKLSRVLILSGSSESVLAGIRASVAGVVQKPFEPKDLVAAVRRVAAPR
jgi:DNA-binding response OmpR family regulator